MEFDRRTLCLTALTFGALACEPSRRPEPPPAEAAGTNSALDDGSRAGGSSGGAAGSSDGPSVREWPEVSFVYEPDTTSSALSPDSACASAVAPAEPSAMDMYLLLDRSQTMSEPMTTIPTCKVGDLTTARWCFAINALDGFFAAPTSNGMGIALQFFPGGDCGWLNYPTEQDCCYSGECCAGGVQSEPAVALGRLPDNRAALADALDAQDPLGSTTPIEAALRGLFSYTFAASTEARTMVGVLITDGDPNGCESEPNLLAQLVREHRETTSISTFVIGMDGADYGILETIAEAGGAPSHSSYCAGGIEPCHFYDVGNGTPTAFIDALQQIQRSVAGCEFAMPSTAEGVIDPEDVLLQYSSRAQALPRELPHREQASDCGQEPGFYYEPPNAPERLVLCPATCARARSDYAVRVEVLLGCLGS